MRGLHDKSVALGDEVGNGGNDPGAIRAGHGENVLRHWFEAIGNGGLPVQGVGRNSRYGTTLFSPAADTFDRFGSMGNHRSGGRVSLARAQRRMTPGP